MPRKIKIVKGNKCGAKINLQKEQQAGKSTEGKGPANRGWTAKQ
jgi:hypothetical protein